jgi:hypothetical protein
MTFLLIGNAIKLILLGFILLGMFSDWIREYVIPISIVAVISCPQFHHRFLFIFVFPKCFNFVTFSQDILEAVILSCILKTIVELIIYDMRFDILTVLKMLIMVF